MNSQKFNLSALVVLALSFTYACKPPRQNKSQEKAISLIEDEDVYNKVSSLFLIGKIAKPLKMRMMPLEGDKGCSKEFWSQVDLRKEFVKSQGLAPWLDGFDSLRSQGLLKDAPTPSREIVWIDDKDPQIADLRIWFHCHERRSFYQIFDDGAVALKEPVIHLLFNPGFACKENATQDDLNDLFPDKNKSDQICFLSSTIAHEFGHAFGLADSYDGNLAASRKPFQPLALMNNSYQVKKPNDDDLGGLAFLYQYLVSKELKDIKDCPKGYKRYAKAEGCIDEGIVEQYESKDAEKRTAELKAIRASCLEIKGTVTPDGKCSCKDDDGTEKIFETFRTGSYCGPFKDISLDITKLNIYCHVVDLTPSKQGYSVPEAKVVVNNVRLTNFNVKKKHMKLFVSFNIESWVAEIKSWFMVRAYQLDQKGFLTGKPELGVDAILPFTNNWSLDNFIDQETSKPLNYGRIPVDCQIGHAKK